MPHRSIRLCALTLALVVVAAGSAGASSSEGPPPGTGDRVDRPVTDVIVQWHSDTRGPAREAVRRAAGLTRQRELLLPHTELVAVPRGQSAEQVVRRLSGQPGVAFAEPDAWLRTSSDDPGFGIQYGLENRGQTVNNRVGTPGIDIRAPQAWAAVAGQPGDDVVVAITDSAIDVSHPDLVDRLWRNPGETVNGLDDDGNGFVDDVHGWNFVTGTPILPGTPAVEDHGTHVTGIAGAQRDNGIGIAGTTDRIQLMAVTFLAPDGAASASAAVDAITYASDNGAQVINASFGGPSNNRALERAIASSPAVVVAAAGNEGKDNDLQPEYPASYALANLVSVTAINSTGGLPAFSNRGRTSVDLGAPGVDIVSTVPNGRYAFLSGTSMAAPFVAGAAAMVRSVRPDLSAGEVVALLEGTVRPLESLRLTTSTGGLLDAEAAVKAAIGGGTPVVAPQAPPAPSVAPPSQPGPAQPRRACPDGIPSSGFADVVGNIHLGPIDCGVWYGLIRGTSATTYSPATSLTRGQIASLLAGLVNRAGRLPASAPDAFDDDNGNVHEANINKLASLGIISGVGNRRFAPERQVTRGQIATLLVGTQEFLTGRSLSGGPTPFTDIVFDTHRTSIEKAFAAGLVRGTSATTYSPAGSTRRDQAASLITRELQELVDAGVIEPKRF
jgi:subtilisin family serine protease